jgi:sRNA-binding protein
MAQVKGAVSGHVVNAFVSFERKQLERARAGRGRNASRLAANAPTAAPTTSHATSAVRWTRFDH